MAPLDGGRRSGLGVPVRQRTYANLADGEVGGIGDVGVADAGRAGVNLIEPAGC
jgi:hypothetical protein